MAFFSDPGSRVSAIIGGHEPTTSVSVGLMNRSPSKDDGYRHTTCRELVYIEMLKDLGLSILDFFAFF